MTEQHLKIKWSSNAKGWIDIEPRKWFEDMLNSDYFARIPYRYLTDPDTRHIESAIADNYLRAKEYISGHGNPQSKFTLAQNHIFAAMALEKLLRILNEQEKVSEPKMAPVINAIEEQGSLF